MQYLNDIVKKNLVVISPLHPTLFWSFNMHYTLSEKEWDEAVLVLN
jgi:hypothetical protein